MSPLGIKRTVAIFLIISPWIFIPELVKEVIFIFAGILLYISTLDLRKKNQPQEVLKDENESKPQVATVS